MPCIANSKKRRNHHRPPPSYLFGFTPSGGVTVSVSSGTQAANGQGRLSRDYGTHRPLADDDLESRRSADT